MNIIVLRYHPAFIISINPRYDALFDFLSHHLTLHEILLAHIYILTHSIINSNKQFICLCQFKSCFCVCLSAIKYFFFCARHVHIHVSRYMCICACGHAHAENINQFTNNPIDYVMLTRKQGLGSTCFFFSDTCDAHTCYHVLLLYHLCSYIKFWMPVRSKICLT